MILADNNTGKPYNDWHNKLIFNARGITVYRISSEIGLLQLEIVRLAFFP